MKTLLLTRNRYLKEHAEAEKEGEAAWQKS